MTMAGLILIAAGVLGWYAGWRNIGGLTPPQGRLLMLGLGLAGGVLVLLGRFAGAAL